MGQNGKTWADMRGLPEPALRVTERFSRLKIGHMDIEVTIDDPQACTRRDRQAGLAPDTGYRPIEICEENNQIRAHGRRTLF
jgi:hypothetical protein